MDELKGVGQRGNDQLSRVPNGIEFPGLSKGKSLPVQHKERRRG